LVLKETSVQEATVLVEEVSELRAPVSLEATVLTPEEISAQEETSVQEETVFPETTISAQEATSVPEAETSVLEAETLVLRDTATATEDMALRATVLHPRVTDTSKSRATPTTATTRVTASRLMKLDTVREPRDLTTPTTTLTLLSVDLTVTEDLTTTDSGDYTPCKHVKLLGDLFEPIIV